MTYDMVALLDGAPSNDDVMAGLAATDLELGVRAVSGGAVLQLVGADGEPLVSMEGPMLVQVPGEVERLLGPSIGTVETPVWWIEVRATARDGARELGERYASALVGRLGGKVWSPDGVTTAPDPTTEEAR